MKKTTLSAIKASACVAAIFILAQPSIFAEDTTVKLNGAPPVALPIKAKQSDIEAKSGCKLEVILTNNPKGLEALRAGEADGALLAPSLKKVVDAMNAMRPGSASADGLQEFTIGQGTVSLIVHPSNPVGALTMAQARDILSGKITNWKDVGGADAAIQVFVLDPSIIPRIVVEDQIMAGTPVTKNAVVRSKPGDMPTLVSQTPDAISFTGTVLVNASVKAVKLEQPLTFPMICVTKGEPTASMKAILEAAKASLGN